MMSGRISTTHRSALNSSATGFSPCCFLNLMSFLSFHLSNQPTVALKSVTPRFSASTFYFFHQHWATDRQLLTSCLAKPTKKSCFNILCLTISLSLSIRVDIVLPIFQNCIFLLQDSRDLARMNSETFGNCCLIFFSFKSL